MTETIGIISSFDILCGNATYSEQLAQGLENLGYKVMRISVPEKLQKKDDKGALTEIIRKSSKCSIVNVQMELGLYGSNPHVAAKNLSKIFTSLSVPTTIAVHRVEKKPDSYLRMVRSKMLQRGFIMSAILALRESSKQRYLFLSYMSVFKKLRKKKNFTVISHILRDKKLLKEDYGIDSICHPIFWPDSLVNRTTPARERNHSGIEIGIFGFISPHKNFPLVVNAFSFLLETNRIPLDSRLIIYGGYHPEAPGYGKDSYYPIQLLNKRNIFPSDVSSIGPTEAISLLLQQKKIQNVDWVVGADDHEMATAISQVDVCVVPYLETGQSGSGITSQAVQFAKNLVMSDTKMTRQHQQLVDNRIVIFDTASVVSLACAILRSLQINNPPRFKKHYSYERLLNIILLNERGDHTKELTGRVK